MEALRLLAGGHIVFVCYANKNRSPMAAALFAAKMGERGIDCRVESAGCANYNFRAAEEWSQLEETKMFDLSDHFSRHVSLVSWTKDTLFACLDEEVRDHMRSIPNIVFANLLLVNPPHGVFDPESSHSLPAYRKCFQEIESGVDQLVAMLVD